MRNITFLSLLLIIALTSCAPSATATPTTMIVVFPTTTTIPIITLTPNSLVTISTPTSEVPSPTAEPFIMSELASPNGKYIAYSYFYYGTEQQTLEIQDKEGKLIWQIPFQGELPHYDPRPTIGAHLWSNDSSQLYFCYYWSPDGGDIFIRYSCRELQTIDIKTGEIQTVVPDGYTAFEISPNGSQLAYLQCNDETCAIHVRNLSTGSEKAASAIANLKDYIAEGGISWSPNGNSLVFHTQDAGYMLQTLYLDISTMKLRLIKKYPVPGFQDNWAAFDGWVDDNILRFVESGNPGEQVVYLNIRNNESVVIGTPTPSY